jgi:hypothetical protein
MRDDHENIDIGGLAALINSRLGAEARVAKTIGFAWLCGGTGIALCLSGLGVAAALYGYSFMLSVRPAAEQTAKALVDAFERTQLKTTVSGVMSLAPTELRLAKGQTIKLHEGTTVRLDPNSSVRVIGDIKMPQPSKEQLQIGATSASDELPFTSYVVFKGVSWGRGSVESGWYYELSDTTRPRYQFCHYRESIDQGLTGKIPLAVNGSPQRPSNSTKLPFNFDEAVSNCLWVSGT